jgi:hypothetical protein
VKCRGPIEGSEVTALNDGVVAYVVRGEMPRPSLKFIFSEDQVFLGKVVIAELHQGIGPLPADVRLRRH